jgi:hypothetical protein
VEPEHIAIVSSPYADAIASGATKMFSWGGLAVPSDCSQPEYVRIVAYEITFAVVIASLSALLEHVWLGLTSPSNVGGLMLYCVNRSKYELQTSAFVIASICSLVGPRIDGGRDSMWLSQVSVGLDILNKKTLRKCAFGTSAEPVGGAVT